MDTTKLQDALRELFWDSPTLESLPTLVLSLVAAAILGTLLGQAYIYFGRSLSNRRMFAANFLLLTVTTTLVITIVKSSLALSLGAVGGKVSHPLPAMALDGDDPRRVVDAALHCGDVPPLLRAAAGLRMPTLVNRYQRHYFVSADGNYRLTVDWDLQFAGFARFAADGSLSAAGPSVIIELKYAPCHADRAADAVSNALPFRLARCSKYVLGVQRITSGALP